MNTTKTSRSRVSQLAVWMMTAFALTLHSLGVDGTWTNLAGGAWNTTGNWAGGNVAGGSDAIADFSTLNITAGAFVNNDAARTVGTLRFGDTTPSHNWNITNSTLTLAVSSGTPTITVDNQTATVSVGLKGTQGLIKNGAGTLSLDARTKTDAGNTYSGGTYVLAGTLRYGASGANYVANKLGTGPVYLGDTNGSASVVLGQIYDTDILPNTIVLQSGNSGTITIQGSGGNDQFDGTVTLGSPNSSGKGLTLASGGNLTFSFIGVIQDPAGLTPGTAGQVTIAASPVLFSGNNSYSGGTVINSGSLQLGHVSALGSGGLTVNGGRVDLNAKSITVGSLSGSGGIITDTGAAGTTTLTVTQSVATTYSGVISNGASRVIAFTKTGSGTLTLAGRNTYSGATTINAGGLIGVTGGSCMNSSVTVADGASNGVQVIVSDGQWACSNLTYSAGTTTLDINLGSVLPSTTTAPLLVVGNLDMGTVGIHVRNGLWPTTPGIYPLVSYSGVLSGTVPGTPLTLPSGLTATIVNNTGSKRIDLNVTAVTWAPSSYNTWTNLVSGNASGSWGNSANWSNNVPNGVDALADFSTLNITVNSTVNNDSPHTVGQLRFGDTSPSHNWALTNSTLTLATSLGLPTIDVSNGSVTIGTALLGTQGLCKTGDGQLNIDQKLPSNATGSNTYSGGTYILAGTLMFGTYNNNNINGLIGSGTVYLGDIGGSANVVLQSEYGSYSLTNNIVLQSGNTGKMQVNNNGGWLTLSGTITLGKANSSGKGLTFGKVSTGGLYMNGVIQDPVGMTPGTAGTVTIASPGYVIVNAANTYSGATVIDAGGTWYANAANNGGLPAGTALTVNGTLDMIDRTIKVGSLAGTGIVDRTYNGGSAQTLTVGSDNTSTVFSGVIKNSRPSYPVSLTKRGSGMLTLAGTNTYTGATTVSNGTLAVSGALSSSGVTVCTGAAFAAGSTGVVGRATLGGTLTFQNNSRLLVDVASTTADAVSAAGNITLTGTVTLEVSGDQTRGGNWKVLESTGGTITGDFVLSGARIGSTLTKSANSKEIWLDIPRKGTLISFF
jgi:autotransporter-associated beta strand protein